MNFGERIREWLVCGVLLAIPFFFLRANLRDPSNTNPLDQFVLEVSSPVQYAATKVAGVVSSAIEDYTYLVDVREENATLSQEVAELRQKARRLRHVEQENRRLRDMLGLRERFEGDTLTAQVVGKEVSPFFRVTRIRLDRGDPDNLTPGMPVISSQGLVGQIRRTFGRYSDVLMTVDRTSAVDVVVQRTGARGVLRGTGQANEYLGRIQYLERSEEIAVGDEIHTSGLGQRFPAAILLGTVTAVRRQDFGLYQEVDVAPSVNFSGLDEVFILTQGSREQAASDPLDDLPRRSER